MVANGQLNFVLSPGTLNVGSATPASLTGVISSITNGALPTAIWTDTTGSGAGWQAQIAATNFSYTGNWMPVGSAPALSSSSSSPYVGVNDGEEYTLSITSVSGSTVGFSYKTNTLLSGTGTATMGAASPVGTEGLSITFNANGSYVVGDQYTIEVGAMPSTAMTLDPSGGVVTPVSGTLSVPPSFSNALATIPGGGASPTAYGTGITFASAALNNGMGQYKITPSVTVNVDSTAWAATYTAGIQYSIISGP